eukprot:CAMPEP_0184341184 /NCGR_PEP_ID=MMETSP1089-20130417/9813_1 /TAXON_ID=38269 ORGANISM="Gloeochaete wittrockiana, Strain SAG46.84" /NCGR_SAMPLE_ID=MMETSP1089 /ASSEMBLY_ACC=CAM_ASM_000445 /LENGTH=88 /DNA_ID=CAMNT_0026669347 /DNA_START=71 /DNA_END=334 /DNA_ORIENTATION=-
MPVVPPSVSNTNTPIAPSKRRISKRKKSMAEDEAKVVDFSILDISALKRYKKHFKLRVRLNKQELQLVAAKHFQEITVNEADVIKHFL